MVSRGEARRGYQAGAKRKAETMEAENGDNAKQSIDKQLVEAIAEGRVNKTRNGIDARIYATDAGGDYPIHGAVRASKSEHWALRTWTVQGRHQLTGTSALDLVIGPRTIEVDFWVNVYNDGSTFRYETKKAADMGALKNRFACINIKRTVTEGEGL